MLSLPGLTLFLVRLVFIVTASKWGQYLGKIDVAYNSQGKIVAYTGAPILMDNTTAQEPTLQAQIVGWRKPFEALSKIVVGQSAALLDGESCQTQECAYLKSVFFVRALGDQIILQVLSEMQ